MVKDSHRINNTLSRLSQKKLDGITKLYRIDHQFKPQLPSPSQTITNPHLGFIWVYQQFFKVVLRLPAFAFLRVITDHYKFHFTQITPNGFRKIICFVMLCEALNIVLTLPLFHYFYMTMVSKDWISFSLRHGLINICDGFL